MLGINPSFLLCKGHYFAFFGGIGSISPFLGSIALQFGATPSLIGIIYATLPFFILVAKPSFAMLADVIQQRKLILLVCMAFMSSSFFFIIFIPQKVGSRPLSKGLRCNAKSSFLSLCDLSMKDRDAYAEMTGSVSCDFRCKMDASENPKAPLGQVSFTAEVSLDEVTYEANCAAYPLKSFKMANRSQAVPSCDSETYAECDVTCSRGFASGSKATTDTRVINPQLIYLWILMILGFAFMGTAIALADAIIIGILPNIGLYGRQRLFGPMGYGMLSILTGILVDHVSKKGQPINFKPCLFLVLIMGTLDFVIIFHMPVRSSSKPKNLMRHVCRLFAQPETLLFAVAVACVGFFTGILWTFLIVYSNMLGGSQLLTGLIYGTQCFAGDVPFMFMSGWFLRKLGHGHAMTLVLTVFAVRFFLYSAIRNPWMILPIEVSQGITFGIFLTALATYSSLIAPPATNATLQGIFQGLFEGLGNGTGSLIGGMVFEAVGGSMMWLIMGVALGILATAHGLILVMIQRKAKGSPPEEEQQQMEEGDAEEAASSPQETSPDAQ